MDLRRFPNKFLSSLLYGFKKWYGAQYVLINLQNWQKCFDASDGIVGILLMDVSKAYNCFNRDLIIANLEAHGVGKNSLRLIQNYLFQRQQGVKVGSPWSETLAVILGVTMGSILKPILFNCLFFFLNIIFLFFI